MEIKINVRFNIGDEVFAMKDNRVKKVLVNSLNVYMGNDGRIRITYYDSECKSYGEEDCYKTQQELWDAIRVKES